MTEAQVTAQRGKVELAVFDVSGTEPTVKVSGVESRKVGEQEPSSIAAVGDTFVCGFFGDKHLRLLGFKLSDGKGSPSQLGEAGPEYTIGRLAPDSTVDLSPSIHGDGFILIDCDGAKVIVRKLSPAMAQVGEWTLQVPKEAEAPIRQLVFNERMAFLHLSDSKGKIIVRTAAGSTDVLWPSKMKRGAR